MDKLIGDVARNRQLWRAGELFHIEDSFIEPCLLEFLEAIKQIILSPGYETTINDQNVAEICLARCVSVVKTTKNHDKYNGKLVDILHCCLHYPLYSVSGIITPHAKIASDILTHFFLNYSKLSSLDKFLKAAIKFLLCGNHSIVENLSCFFLLIIDSHISLFAEHINIILGSIIRHGNYTLAPLLMNLQGVDRDRLITRNLKYLLQPSLQNKGETVRNSLLKLVTLIYEEEPKAVENCLRSLIGFLNYSSSVMTTINVLNEIFWTNQKIFYYHVTGLMQVGLTANPGDFHLIGSLLVSICSTNKMLSRDCLVYLTACLFHKTMNSTIIFAWIESLLLTYVDLVVSLYDIMTHLESTREITEFMTTVVVKLKCIIFKCLQQNQLKTTPLSLVVNKEPPKRNGQSVSKSPQLITDEGKNKNKPSTDPDVTGPLRKDFITEASSAAETDDVSRLPSCRSSSVCESISHETEDKVISDSTVNDLLSGKVADNLNEIQKLLLNTESSKDRSLTILSFNSNEDQLQIDDVRNILTVKKDETNPLPDEVVVERDETVADGKFQEPVATDNNNNNTNNNNSSVNNNNIGINTNNRNDKLVQSALGRNSYFENIAFTSSQSSLYDEVYEGSAYSTCSNYRSSVIKVNNTNDNNLKSNSCNNIIVVDEKQTTNIDGFNRGSPVDEIEIDETFKERRHNSTPCDDKLDNHLQKGIFPSSNHTETAMSLSLLANTDSKSTLNQDTLEYNCDGNRQEIDNFIKRLLLKIPIPSNVVVSVANKTQEKFFIEFHCPSRDNRCAFGRESRYKIETKHLQTWLQILFLTCSNGKKDSQCQGQKHPSIRGNTSRPLFGVVSCCSSHQEQEKLLKKVKWIWNTYMDKSLNKVVNSGFPSEKEIFKISKELKQRRCFDLFTYNKESGGWSCFICKKETRNSIYMRSDGSLNMNGLLKEKSGYLKFLKPWKVTRFLIDGFNLSYVRNDQPIKLEEITKIKARDRNMLLSKYTTVSLTAVKGNHCQNDISHSDNDSKPKKKKLTLRFFDQNEATTWIRCLYMVMAKFKSMSDSLDLLNSGSE